MVETKASDVAWAPELQAFVAYLAGLSAQRGADLVQEKSAGSAEESQVALPVEASSGCGQAQLGQQACSLEPQHRSLEAVAAEQQFTKAESAPEQDLRRATDLRLATLEAAVCTLRSDLRQGLEEVRAEVAELGRVAASAAAEAAKAATAARPAEEPTAGGSLGQDLETLQSSLQKHQLEVVSTQALLSRLQRQTDERDEKEP
eukprot:TRINITY_DN16508_c0_g1_i2.p1 TRINITY_DN16508_c0_g1~~TRINITY_DN16508_c0_g1_i2.p1  ORF type:complete len:214 (-),score=62.62 TRINITY_DN16508_c0_g1_i2:415-1023(-)